MTLNWDFKFEQVSLRRKESKSKKNSFWYNLKPSVSLSYSYTNLIANKIPDLKVELIAFSQDSFSSQCLDILQCFLEDSEYKL